MNIYIWSVYCYCEISLSLPMCLLLNTTSLEEFSEQTDITYGSFVNGPTGDL